MSRGPGGLAPAFDARSFAASSTWIRGKGRPPITEEQFWKQVAKGEPSACWLWTGPRAATGYGRVHWHAVTVGAHRLSYSLAKGPIAEGLVVRHACDVPLCVNPNHLLLGTIADNNQDTIDRGRTGVSHLVAFGKSSRGTGNVNAKLTDALVVELRRAHQAGESIKSISQRTGLATGTIHPMLHGRTWKHVPGIRHPLNQNTSTHPASPEAAQWTTTSPLGTQ